MTESQRVRRCVYLARPCNVCGCAIVVNSKKAKEEGDVGNMAGLRCHRPNTCQNLLKEKNAGRGVEVDGTLVGDVAKRPPPSPARGAPAKQMAKKKPHLSAALLPSDDSSSGSDDDAAAAAAPSAEIYTQETAHEAIITLKNDLKETRAKLHELQTKGEDAEGQDVAVQTEGEDAKPTLQHSCEIAELEVVEGPRDLLPLSPST